MYLLLNKYIILFNHKLVHTENKSNQCKQLHGFQFH